MQITLMTIGMLFRTVIDNITGKQTLEEAKNKYESMLDTVIEAGYQVVDVTSYEVKVFGLDYVAEQLSNRGIAVSSVICTADFACCDKNRDKEITELGKQGADYCKALNSNVLMLVPDDKEDLSRYSVDEIHNALISHFSPVTEYAVKLGINVVIEDAPQLQYQMCRAEHVKKIMDAVPDLELVYDSGNMVLVDEDPVEYIQNFIGRIGHVHLKDMKEVPADTWGADIGIDGIAMTAAQSGDGIIDLPSVLDALKKVGYQGYCTIEYVPDDSKDDLKRLIESREYCEGLMDI